MTDGDSRPLYNETIATTGMTKPPSRELSDPMQHP